MNSATPFRLGDGGLIDRSRPLSFTFDGRTYAGFAGDTLASALLANGVRLVGRSFKYHRPRGILSAGSEEPNALVELRAGARREPNTRATVVELYDGLAASSQNRWPSLRADLLSLNALLAPIFPAGFYYKTFMWPAAFWEKLYEPAIRRAAGLGRAAPGDDPDHYETVTGHCDVLVIGGGPAGLMAALNAARTGARVILCDEDFRLGGRALAEPQTIDGVPASHWAAATESMLAGMPEVRLLRRTTVFGVYDGTYGAVERANDHMLVPPEHEPRQRLWRIVAKRSVLCAGAIEQPLVFAGNDRPGIMLAGAVRTYIDRFAVKPGRRAVVVAAHGDALRTARSLKRAGIEIAAIVRPNDDTRSAEYPVVAGAVTHSHGRQTLRAVTVEKGTGGTRTIECDLLAMSGGWSPTIHLATHLGGKPRWNDALGAFVANSPPREMIVAGAAAGKLLLAECLADGSAAGRDAAVACGFPGERLAVPTTEPEEAAVEKLLPTAGMHHAAFVDFQNDVTLGDLALAQREGLRSVEHVKRYTTLGMATDQGKTSNLNGLAAIAAMTRHEMATLGTTRHRPPFTPVPIGVLAGPHRGKEFKPTRLTPSHDWAAAQGAAFVTADLWLRAQYFPRPGDTGWQDAVVREVNATRNGVGVCDVSTLGKIDVQGPDAGGFLDRLYVNSFSTLQIGKARYGLMLREDGIALDDGTVSRLDHDHYFVTTTTANAAKVMQHMEFCRQVVWPDVDVQLASVTEQWAQFAIAGPQSRVLLQQIVDDHAAIADAAFPYLAATELRIFGGIKGRLFRISFSGERAYELAVPARFGDAVIRHLLAAGREFDAVSYGTEALGTMRIEKGHVAGNELNGQTTAPDLGLGRMISTRKDYVGRVMAERPGLTDPARPRLVGCVPVDRRERLHAGAHFIPVGAAAEAKNDHGYLTSATYSPTLGHWIGLGFLARGVERIGETVRACDPLRGREVSVSICSPVFYDPSGERLRG